MPSAFSHPAVPLAMAMVLGSRRVSPQLLILGVLLSVAPDLDVLAFRFGIPYADALGHRGASHSLLIALLAGLAALACAKPLRSGRWLALGFVFVATASHGLLDMLTNGGHGVALVWPWADERLWWPWRPIEVSPLSLGRFFTDSGLKVLGSELLWIWLPALSLGLLGLGLRARLGRPRG